MVAAYATSMTLRLKGTAYREYTLTIVGHFYIQP